MSKSETSGDDPSRPWQSYHTAYTNAKAGMEGVDKEKVQRTIYEMSKGSKYFENEERKEASMKQKIENMRARCAELTEADLSHYQKVADMRILELEATRDLSRIWLHVDMDAFYAAVETLSNPSLKGKPMAVGSMSMISTANYEARRYGVRAAMPGFIARKLCPELIFVPVDFKKYTYYSGLTRKVFQKYDPNFMAASLDEAYLDITNVCKERGIVSTEVAEELRQCVFEATGLTCSAGVAPNRLLAKVCSDINKPNSQFVLPSDRTVVMKFISTLPIRKIGGIGKVTENILKDVFGIKTCEEMLQKSCFLYALFSSSSADFFLSAGLGIGSTDTPQVRSRKSISNERTFSATKDQTFLFQKIVELAEMLSSDMEREGLRGRTLTLKLKTASFEVRSRAVTLQNYISSTEDILKHASKLLKAELPLSLRLLGLRISHFSEDSDGSPSDPTQKTISKFIKYSDANDNLSKINSDTDLPNNDTTSYDSRDQFHSLPVSDCTDNNCILEAENRTNMNDGYNDKVYDSSSKSEPSHLEVSNNVCLANKRTRFSDDEAGTSFSKKDTTLLWENGYKCLLCGIELPPSFTEERQEHSDFHLAERLQEEESCNNHIHHPINQRFRQKDEIANRSRKGKKQKSSPVDGKHIPIDMFFVKRSQNL